MENSRTEMKSSSDKGERSWDSSRARLEEIGNILGDDPDPTAENISLMEETTDILYWCLENLNAEKKEQDNG